METIKLVLSMQDVSRILQCVVQQPYVQVSDLVENIKRQVEANAAEFRSMGQGVQAGAQASTAIPAAPLPNGETH